MEEKTILIVEDEYINVMYIKEVLKYEKYKLLLAWDGIEAVKLCEDTNIDLILMDMKMPVMDGYKATNEIKKIKPEIPVIAQTAFAFAKDKQQALDAGCVDWISKPFSPDELLNMIKKYI